MAEAAALATRDNRIAKAVDAFVAHLRDRKNVPEPSLWELGEFSEEEIVAIFALAHKQAKDGEFDFEQFVKKMDATKPVLARPRGTDKALDLWRMLSQPEILERLWPRWKARTGKRGRHPGFFAKALLVVTAALGKSAHFDDNYEELSGNPARRGVGDLPRDPDARPTSLRVVFEWVERMAAAATGASPEPFADKSYEKALEQVTHLVDQKRNSGALTTEACVATNIDLLRWLSTTYPEVGKRLGIDGMLIKAYVKQVGKKESPAEEQLIRGSRAPNASARFLKGKGRALGRFVRGWYLFVLTDLATGLPVVWGLWPAGDTNSEARALRFMLNDLFEQWPECPTTHIVADRAWDNKEAIRDCAVRFGIHLIVGRHHEDEERRDGEAAEPSVKALSRFDSPDISSFDRLGNAYCRHDGVAMRRKSADFLGPDRRRTLGLKPGEAAPDNAFRLRLECPVGDCPGAKKAQLHMHHDWAALSVYPHTADSAREDLHAERLALYARRNTCESLFGALKLGHKLGLDGADRTHTANERTVETLLSLALLLRTAFVTAHERIEQGAPAQPPPDLAATLAATR